MGYAHSQSWSSSASFAGTLGGIGGAQWLDSTYQTGLLTYRVSVDPGAPHRALLLLQHSSSWWSITTYRDLQPTLPGRAGLDRQRFRTQHTPMREANKTVEG